MKYFWKYVSHLAPTWKNNKTIVVEFLYTRKHFSEFAIAI